MKSRIPYVYCICRIDPKTWHTINQNIHERGYSDIRCFVPTVKILSKSKAKKHQYKEIPLLFNYGFVRMRSTLAYDRDFLREFTKEISGIVGFLRSLDYMHPKKKRRRVDNADIWDDFSKVATVSREEFKRYRRIAKSNQIYHLGDIAAKVGDNIILRKYPFDGLLAKIIDFSYTNKTVRVEIYPGAGSVLQLQLPLDNVLYTIYDSYDEDNLLADSCRVDISTLGDEEPIDDFEPEIDT